MVKNRPDDFIDPSTIQPLAIAITSALVTNRKSLEDIDFQDIVYHYGAVLAGVTTTVERHNDDAMKRHKAKFQS